MSYHPLHDHHYVNIKPGKTMHSSVRLHAQKCAEVDAVISDTRAATHEEEHVDQLSEKAVVLLQILGQAFQVVPARQLRVSSLLLETKRREGAYRVSNDKRE